MKIYLPNDKQAKKSATINQSAFEFTQFLGFNTLKPKPKQQATPSKPPYASSAPPKKADTNTGNPFAGALGGAVVGSSSPLKKQIQATRRFLQQVL